MSTNEATIHKQNQQDRVKAAKYRKRHAKWLKHHKPHKLTPNQKKAVHKMMVAGVFKKIGKLREALNLPSTTETLQHPRAFVTNILEWSADSKDPRDFAKVFLAKDPEYTATNTGLGALQFEAWMVENAKELFAKFLETEVDPGESTFLATFEGALTSDDYAKMGEDTSWFLEYETLISAGEVDKDTGEVADFTILECKVTEGAKLEKPTRVNIDPKADEKPANNRKNIPEGATDAADPEGPLTTAEMQRLYGLKEEEATLEGDKVLWRDPETQITYTMMGDRWYNEGTLTESSGGEAIADSGKWAMVEREPGIVAVTLLDPDSKDSVTWEMEGDGGQIRDDMEEIEEAIRLQSAGATEEEIRAQIDDAIAAYFIDYGINATEAAVIESGGYRVEVQRSDDIVSVPIVETTEGRGGDPVSLGGGSLSHGRRFVTETDADDDAKKEGIKKAHVIRDQIGHKARFMLGAKHETVDHGHGYNIAGKDIKGSGKPTHAMRIGKNNKGVNHIKTELNHDDTYDVTFGAIRGTNYKVKHKESGITADQWHDTVEKHTNMRTSLGTLGKHLESTTDEEMGPGAKGSTHTIHVVTDTHRDRVHPALRDILATHHVKTHLRFGKKLAGSRHGMTYTVSGAEKDIHDAAAKMGEHPHVNAAKAEAHKPTTEGDREDYPVTNGLHPHRHSFYAEKGTGKRITGIRYGKDAESTHALAVKATKKEYPDSHGHTTTPVHKPTTEADDGEKEYRFSYHPRTSPDAKRVSMKVKGKNMYVAHDNGVAAAKKVHPKASGFSTFGNQNESIEEKAPPGWSGTVKSMKKHSEITNPFALAWAMKKKGATPHKATESVVEAEKADIAAHAKKFGAMDTEHHTDDTDHSHSVVAFEKGAGAEEKAKKFMAHMKEQGYTASIGKEHDDDPVVVVNHNEAAATKAGPRTDLWLASKEGKNSEWVIISKGPLGVDALQTEVQKYKDDEYGFYAPVSGKTKAEARKNAAAGHFADIFSTDDVDEVTSVATAKCCGVAWSRLTTESVYVSQVPGKLLITLAGAQPSEAAVIGIYRNGALVEYAPESGLDPDVTAIRNQDEFAVTDLNAESATDTKETTMSGAVGGFKASGDTGGRNVLPEPESEMGKKALKAAKKTSAEGPNAVQAKESDYTVSTLPEDEGEAHKLGARVQHKQAPKEKYGKGSVAHVRYGADKKPSQYKVTQDDGHQKWWDASNTMKESVDPDGDDGEGATTEGGVDEMMHYPVIHHKGIGDVPGISQGKKTKAEAERTMQNALDSKHQHAHFVGMISAKDRDAAAARHAAKDYDVVHRDEKGHAKKTTEGVEEGTLEKMKMSNAASNARTIGYHTTLQKHHEEKGNKEQAQSHADTAATEHKKYPGNAGKWTDPTKHPQHKVGVEMAAARIKSGRADMDATESTLPMCDPVVESVEGDEFTMQDVSEDDFLRTISTTTDPTRIKRMHHFVSSMSKHKSPIVAKHYGHMLRKVVKQAHKHGVKLPEDSATLEVQFDLLLEAKNKKQQKPAKQDGEEGPKTGHDDIDPDEALEFDLEDVQTYYDMLLVRSVEEADAIVKVMEKFGPYGLTDLTVGPTGVVRSTDFPNEDSTDANDWEFAGGDQPGQDTPGVQSPGSVASPGKGNPGADVDQDDDETDSPAPQGGAGNIHINIGKDGEKKATKLPKSKKPTTEDAALIAKLSRNPERQVFIIDCADMSEADAVKVVKALQEKVKGLTVVAGKSGGTVKQKLKRKAPYDADDIHADHSNGFKFMFGPGESVDEAKLNDKDFRQFFVSGKSIVIDNVWWTIRNRDLDKDTCDLVVSDYAIKDGHKPGKRTVKYSAIMKNINSGKWGGSTPAKGHMGHKQDKMKRAALRKKNGLRAPPGTADAVKEGVDTVSENYVMVHKKAPTVFNEKPVSRDVLDMHAKAHGGLFHAEMSHKEKPGDVHYAYKFGDEKGAKKFHHALNTTVLQDAERHAQFADKKGTDTKSSKSGTKTSRDSVA